MRYASTRLAILASLTFLALWILTSLLFFLGYTVGNQILFEAFSGDVWYLDLPIMGFIGLMIMGMAQHFVPLFAARDLYSERLGVLQVALAIAGVVSDLLSSVLPILEVLGKALWFLGSVLFVGLILATLRQEPKFARPQGRRPELHAVDRWAIPLTAAAIFYLLAASAGFLLASPRGAPLSGWAAENWFSFLHLYTLGFIALMIFGVGFHLFPRFLDAVPRLAGVKAVTVLALVGPAGVALTMPLLGDGAPMESLFAFFASFEAVAAVLYALLVVDLWLRSPKRRPAARFTVVGVVWLIAGVSLAVWFGIGPAMGVSLVTVLAWTPIHGWINLLGFAGFEIFGVTHEILPPFTPKGLKAVRRAALADFLLATAGLVLVIAGYDAYLRGSGFAGPLWVLGLVLLLAMVLVYAIGTVVTLRAIVLPRRRK